MKDTIGYFRDKDGDIWKWKNRRYPVFIYYTKYSEFEYQDEDEEVYDFKTAYKVWGLVKITKEEAFLEIL